MGLGGKGCDGGRTDVRLVRDSLTVYIYIHMCVCR